MQAQTYNRDTQNYVDNIQNLIMPVHDFLLAFYYLTSFVIIIIFVCAVLVHGVIIII